MRVNTLPLLVALLSLNTLLTAAIGGEVTLQSGPARTHLLELFTSEGCSSCPPAEKWLSQLKTSPRLWKDFVPIAFHVDYWDSLGWSDRFASPTHTARQRLYATAWGSRSVYTPNFVLDGRDWQERSVERLSTPDGNAGVLVGTVRDRRTVSVTYRAAHAGRWEAHVAVLGFGVGSNVKAGENSGRKLLHDFVALSHVTKEMSGDSAAVRAEVTLPTPDSGEAGVAIWVTEAGKPEPVQAVGGTL